MTDIKKTYLHGAKMESTTFESIVVQHMKQAGIDGKRAWVIAQNARQAYLAYLKELETA